VRGRGSRFAALALALIAMEGLTLACKPAVSDTGYVGTWVRGNEMNRSTVYLARFGDAYRFRWRVDSKDGKWRVSCDWEGNCTEEVDHQRAATYRFETRIDPATGHLLLECRGEVLRPKRLSVYYQDELVVAPGGRVLWSFTNVRGDERFEGDARPRRSFDKVSDEVGSLPARKPA
jgi:hypothetical protein